MRLGNSNSAGTAKMRKGRVQGLNRKRFSSFYSNAISTNGDCALTSSTHVLNRTPGTFTFRKGSDKVLFVDDTRRVSLTFSLRSVTAERVFGGVHNITIP